MSGSPSKGISRTVWNLRSNATNPIGSGGNGFLVAPGTYYVSVSLVKNGTVEELVAKTAFEVKALNNQTLVAKNPQELAAFRSEVSELNRKVSGANRLMDESIDELSQYGHEFIERNQGFESHDVRLQPINEWRWHSRST
jgi:hypothetical protein